MRRRLLIVSIVALVIIVDQWTKVWARVHLETPREWLGGLVALFVTENSGAFLSLGANLPPMARTILFGVFVGLTLAFAAYALVTGRVRAGEAYAVSLVVGGGIGNLIDRVARGGRVTDFIYMEAGPLHTGVFNVADVAITAGVIWLFLASLTARPRTPAHPADSPSPPSR
ncbi:MAG TPA: signal peptidase II [Thermoanaerobaculia bacterium]|jgi:signal peptidase II|nr:signal peptidase II [Thermoanaerobaculia bacterium]